MKKNTKLEKENTKLRIALCNLRDEYLDMGGDPNQLELFDKNDVIVLLCVWIIPLSFLWNSQICFTWSTTLGKLRFRLW